MVRGPRRRDHADMTEATILKLVRYALPAVIVAVGVVAVALDQSVTTLEGGAGFVGAGLSVWLLNVLHRIGVDGERDRVEEDRAREFFDRHGRWPDDVAHG